MAATLLTRAQRGDRTALGRLITRAETGVDGVNAQVVGHLGHARIIAVAGAAGMGKSTLIGALVGRYRSDGLRVAVVTVDPSGNDGGAVLGDRIRLGEWAGDPDVFIRSMASRGHPGGLAPATPLVLRVLDACRFDVILLEAATVSTDVISQSDTVVLVLTPDSGDAVQLSKAQGVRGADVVVVNKADRAGLRRTVTNLREMTDVPVISTIAPTGSGVRDLQAAIDAHAPDAPLDHRLRERVTQEIEAIAIDMVRVQMVDAPDLAQRVIDGELEPTVAAQLMTGIY